MIDVVHNRDQLEPVREGILIHLNNLRYHEHIKILEKHFKYTRFLEDPDLPSYSESFKAAIFNTIDKVGVDNLVDNGVTFRQYVSRLLQSIENRGLDNFDVHTFHFIYSICNKFSQEDFDLNFGLLTNFIFKKVLPELDTTKE